MRSNSDIPEEKIREVLRRVLESHTFEGVERLKKFLEFVVGEKLAGRGDQLKEYAVGEYAFGKGVSFDPRNDPIVRVQARRLRARLERYQQSEGREDEYYIDMPKGGYAPTFRKRESDVQRKANAAVLHDRNRVVVTPFVNASGEAAIATFCKGLHQDLVHALMQLDGLTVLAGDDLPAKGSAAAAIAISGIVQHRGNRLRVTAQLIDISTGNYLSSDLLERAYDGDDFSTQDEVVNLVTSRIREGLSQEGWRDKRARPPRNLAAHNLYLQGRYQLDQRTEDSLRQAVALFERAIAEDGQFANAYAGLADAYELLGHYGVLAPVEVWTKAPSSAVTAVLLDERSAEAHTALAHVRSTQDWDWVGAEHEFRRAIELDPRSATAHHWYAMACLSPMDRLDEALESIRTASALAPLSSIISRDIATVLYYRRDYDLALEQCDRAIELNPYFSQAYWTLGFIQEQRGEHAEATAAFTRALELAPDSPRNKGALGRLLAVSGEKRAAQQILKELLATAEKRYVSPLVFASLYFALEEESEGYEWLRKAFQDRCFELLLLRVDPKFDPFRGNKIFQELSERLGLPKREA